MIGEDAWVLTPYDRQMARRSLGLAMLAFAVGFLLSVATDEGHLTWSVKLGRALPVAPVAGAAGAWLSRLRGGARHEDVALAALGRAPWQMCAAAALGGASVALLAALAIALLPSVDMSGFFPALPRASTYRFEDGGFVDAAHGVMVHLDGSLGTLAARPDLAPATPWPAGARAVASLTTLVAGVALGLAGARVDRRTWRRLGLLVAGGLTASVMAFQAAAAGRIPPGWAVVPSILLLAAVAFRYRDGAWQRSRTWSPAAGE